LYVTTDLKYGFKGRRLPQRISQEDLAKAIKENDTEAIINGHLRFVMKLVSRLSYRAPHKINDLVGVALCALVKGANDLKSKSNPSGYLNKKITWALRAFLCDDHIIPVPHTTWYGKKMQSSIRDPISLSETKTEKIDDELWVTPLIAVHAKQEVSTEIREILGMLPRNSRDAKIMVMRIQGYTDREIAINLGLSLSRVAQIRNELYNRYILLERSA